MRKIDWNRSYGTNYGGSGGRYTQDGIDFNPDGTEFVPREEAPEEVEEETQEEEAPEPKPTLKPLADRHWREIREVYERHGFTDWDSLPKQSKKQVALRRIMEKSRV